MDKKDKIEINEVDALKEEINRRLPHKESPAYLFAVLGFHHFCGDKDQDGPVNLDRRVKELSLRFGESMPLLVKMESGIHHPEFLGKNRQTYILFEAKYEAGRILIQTKISQQPGIVWLTIKDLFSRLPWLTRIKGIFTPH